MRIMIRIRINDRDRHEDKDQVRIKIEIWDKSIVAVVVTIKPFFDSVQTCFPSQSCALARAPRASGCGPRSVTHQYFE